MTSGRGGWAGHRVPFRPRPWTGPSCSTASTGRPASAWSCSWPRPGTASRSSWPSGAPLHPDRRVLGIAARPTDDAVHFGRRLLRALDEVRPGAAERASADLALDGSALGEALQDVLLEELAAVAPVTLVIEDLENLSSPILLDEIGQMAERAGEGIGFVFVGR